VRLDSRAAPVSVWTGSTNITVSGFLGQSSVGHWMADQEVAATYLRYWQKISRAHTKFLLVDPLSGDDSLTANDENMLLIRGDTRVADIYLTEFDRIFRHFYFRDVANEIEQRGGEAEGAFLDESPESKWTDACFTPGVFKTRRREMFYTRPVEIWVDAAARRPKNETAGGAGRGN